MEMRDLERSASGTNGDSSVNKAPFSGHNLTTENFAATAPHTPLPGKQEIE